MSRIDRVRPAPPARPASRSPADRKDEPGAAARANLPVPVSPAEPARSFGHERRRGAAELTAQLIGQDGQQRGLRAGPAAVVGAQAAYNRVEWSGRYDRRARKGRQTRTEI
jgi:hypothetical protein